MTRLGLPAVPADPGATGRDARIDAATRRARAAEAGGGEELRSAARELEGVFLGMVFEEMAKTAQDESGLFPSDPGREMYESWFRAEVAKSWAQGGGTGLGDTIARSLGGAGVVAATGVAPSAGPPAAQQGVFPVDGPVTSGFGARRHPVTGAVDHHRGIDIGAPEGAPVRAPFAGRVVSVSSDPLLGQLLVIEHRGGFRSLYGHNSAIRVQPGQEVRAGQVVAEVGSTGRATGPHLHFGLYKDGEAVDPQRWLRR